MKIAVIGAGNVGGTLARKWAEAGHSIVIGVRETGSSEHDELLERDNISEKLISEAVADADVIVTATPAMVAVDVAKSLGDTTGKVIIDTMNIVGGRGPEGYTTTSEALLDHTQTDDVVKCFNTTGFNNIADPGYGDQTLDMFMCGDSDKGKKVARQLALDAGFATCYDVGGNDKFALMEQFALFWINLALFQGQGREIGIKLLKR